MTQCHRNPKQSMYYKLLSIFTDQHTSGCSQKSLQKFLMRSLFTFFSLYKSFIIYNLEITNLLPSCQDQAISSNFALRTIILLLYLYIMHGPGCTLMYSLSLMGKKYHQSKEEIASNLPLSCNTGQKMLHKKNTVLHREFFFLE